MDDSKIQAWKKDAEECKDRYLRGDIDAWPAFWRSPGQATFLLLLAFHRLSCISFKRTAGASSEITKRPRFLGRLRKRTAHASSTKPAVSAIGKHHATLPTTRLHSRQTPHRPSRPGGGHKGEGIYYEEVVTVAGFGRAYSIVYHLRPPTRVSKIEAGRQRAAGDRAAGGVAASSSQERQDAQASAIRSAAECRCCATTT